MSQISEITYSEFQHGNYNFFRADSNLTIEYSPNRKFVFNAVGVGTDKHEAQIALHKVLQEVQDKIWEHIFILRDELN